MKNNENYMNTCILKIKRNLINQKKKFKTNSTVKIFFKITKKEMNISKGKRNECEKLKKLTVKKI